MIRRIDSNNNVHVMDIRNASSAAKVSQLLERKSDAAVGGSWFDTIASAVRYPGSDVKRFSDPPHACACSV